MLRRSFLRNTIIASAGTSWLPWESILDDHELANLTILHTNDVHSRIEPFPMDGGINQGLGGVIRRAKKIEQIRRERKHVLLLDAGDIFQGTPYFNIFNGELEIKLMSEMKYDLATIGNHDFDGGIENLALQLNNATFDIINCNYSIQNTPLNDKVKPYKLFRKGGIKIGVYGLGIELKGLVPEVLYGDTIYNDALEKALKIEQYLKLEEKCDFIIGLSHLGYKYRNSKVSDTTIAKNTFHTDLIIGGHSHTFMKEPDILLNKSGDRVLINQVGWGGIMLGRIDLIFEKNKKGRCVSCNNSWLGKKV